MEIAVNFFMPFIFALVLFLSVALDCLEMFEKMRNSQNGNVERITVLLTKTQMYHDGIYVTTYDVDNKILHIF